MHKADFDGSLYRQNAAAQRLYSYAKWMGVGLGLIVAALAMLGCAQKAQPTEHRKLEEFGDDHMPACRWCRCSLPDGMMATCFKSPTGMCEANLPPVSMTDAANGEVVIPRSQGFCDTTMTQRFANKDCVCPTYPENLGPCARFEEGSTGACVYCDHLLSCHLVLGQQFFRAAMDKTSSAAPEGVQEMPVIGTSHLYTTKASYEAMKLRLETRIAELESKLSALPVAEPKETATITFELDKPEHCRAMEEVLKTLRSVGFKTARIPAPPTERSSTP